MGNRIAIGVIIVILLGGGVYFANLSRESDRALLAMKEAAASRGAALDQVSNEKKRLEVELKKRDAGVKKERAALAQLRAASAVYEGNILKLRENIAGLEASAAEVGRRHAGQLSGLQVAAEKSQSLFLKEKEKSLREKEKNKSLEDGLRKREAALLKERAAATRARESELKGTRVKMAEEAAAAAAISQKQAATITSLSRILKNDGAVLRREREAKGNLEKKLKAREGELEDERKRAAQLAKSLSGFEGDILKLQKAVAGKSATAEEISRKLLLTKTSLSEMDARRRAAKVRAREEGQQAAKLRESLEALKKQITGKDLSLKETKDMLRIDIVNHLLFDVGSAGLRAKGRGALDKLVDFFKSQKGKLIRIEGHTDSQPIKGVLARRYPTNWELSAARAIAVVRYLQSKGVPPGLLSAAGYSFYKNEASNETAEGRARNRRIVILMSREKRAN